MLMTVASHDNNLVKNSWQGTLSILGLGSRLAGIADRHQMMGVPMMESMYQAGIHVKRLAEIVVHGDISTIVV
jgi:hypothetical protein